MDDSRAETTYSAACHAVPNTVWTRRCYIWLHNKVPQSQRPSCYTSTNTNQSEAIRSQLLLGNSDSTEYSVPQSLQHLAWMCSRQSARSSTGPDIAAMFLSALYISAQLTGFLSRHWSDFIWMVSAVRTHLCRQPSYTKRRQVLAEE